MKKKLLAVAMCVCLGMTMFGCGKSSEDSTEKTTSKTEENQVDDTAGELNIADYVTLGAYTGLELTKEVTAVTDEDVQSQMETAVVEIMTDGEAVADGDTTNIDYVGKKDGVAFDGGTASGASLVIGSDSFIDGFEDGLIGVKKGETVDLNLTFPENYQNKELAGAEVVFTVTVNGVSRKPVELTDEWFSTNTKYASLEEYRTEVRAQLEQDADDEAQYNLESAALDAVVTNSTVSKYYKTLVEAGENQYENYFNNYASYYGMDLSALLETQGMTEAQFETEKKNQGTSYAQVSMVVMAVAKDAGLTSDDEGYQEILNELASQYGMDTETLNASYGEDVVDTSVMSQYVMEYIAKNSNVTTTTVQPEEETTTAAAE